MAILYKALTELYRETQRKVTLRQSGRRFWLLPAAITD